MSKGPKLFPCCAVVGVGLIGGSLGMALRATGRTVLGLDLSSAILEEAIACGAIDRSCWERPERLAEADLILIAVPPAQVVEAVARLVDRAKSGAVVVDVASVKGPIVGGAEAAAGSELRFVGSHPMFGSEGEGVGAASTEIVRGATWIFTPTAATDPLALSGLERLARELEMQPIRLRVDEHDRALAAVSHLPYLLSVALTRLNPRTDVAGPNFRGMTRVSRSPTALWKEILSLNRDAIREEVDRYCEELRRLSRLEGDSLASALEEARLQAHRQS